LNVEIVGFLNKLKIDCMLNRHFYHASFHKKIAILSLERYKCIRVQMFL